VPDNSNPTDDGVDGLPDALSRLDWDAIPKEQREILQTVLHAQIETIRSPLLPPRLLKEYDEAVPGLATKLVEWTEAEANHRHQMERHAFEVTRAFQVRGQWFGLAVSVFGLSLSAFMVYFSAGTEAAGPAAWVATVVAIVSVGGPFAARLLASRINRQSDSNE
jgi:uncharacterized membrane protein